MSFSTFPQPAMGDTVIHRRLMPDGSLKEYPAILITSQDDKGRADMVVMRHGLPHCARGVDRGPVSHNCPQTWEVRA